MRVCRCLDVCGSVRCCSCVFLIAWFGGVIIVLLLGQWLVCSMSLIVDRTVDFK